MTETRVPHRDEIPTRYTWNAPSVYPTVEDWEAEYRSISEALPALSAYQGRLGESNVLAEALQARDSLAQRTGKLVMYARMAYSVQTTDPAASTRQSQAAGLAGLARAAAAFIEPEILSLGRDRIARLQQEDPRLAVYGHYFEDLFRRQPHLRSTEVEELLGLLKDPFESTSTTASMLTDADMQFAPARTAGGVELPLTQGTLDGILAGPDREARRTAWENYQDAYLAHRNTLAGNLVTSVKQNVFAMRARRHPSTLDAALFADAIPRKVFESLIETFRANLPTWHRYWALRRRALGVETLHPYDIWAPLTTDRPHISYEQAAEWVCEGVAPLGEEYVRTLRRGLLEERWVDVMPNQGKMAGAFSYGWPGTHPFIVMNYDGTIFSLGTVAHESGHSMHSYLTWKHQPFIYSNYSLFVAEVASNLHQALVRAHLLKQGAGRSFKVAVIEEAMSNLHRYFFIMPTLARFELEVHERIERGEGLSADDMIGLMADLFSEGYGGQMHVDRERVGITWATFGHLYVDYYVYQYATGISAANALSRRILSGTPGAAQDYLRFLSAGSSLYPLDALRLAGVDLTTPQPVEEAFAVLAGLVDELEELLAE